MDGLISVIHIGDCKERIGDVKVVKKMLVEVVRGIGMVPHGPPRVVYYPPSSPAKGTHTILCPIRQPSENVFKRLFRRFFRRNFLTVQYLYESFVIYDNWPELGYAHLVVDSCKKYDIVVVLEILKKYFAKVVFKDEQISYGPENIFC